MSFIAKCLQKTTLACHVDRPTNQTAHKNEHDYFSRSMCVFEQAKVISTNVMLRNLLEIADKADKSQASSTLKFL